MQPMPAAPLPSPVVRVVQARDARVQSDYICGFWTALGWTILTFGIYGFYVWYRMIERMREHNRRRLAILEATNEIAWNRAQEQGRQEELRPQFERVAADLHMMRQLSGEFRDPGIWLVLLILGSTVALLILYWLLDADLIKHSAAEGDAEWQLNELLATLGIATPIQPSAPPPKSPHQYAARIIVTILTCGIYSYWWLADLMREGNEHFHRDWEWEDSLVASLHPSF